MAGKITVVDWKLVSTRYNGGSKTTIQRHEVLGDWSIDFVLIVEAWPITSTVDRRSASVDSDNLIRMYSYVGKIEIGVKLKDNVSDYRVRLSNE